MTTSTPVSVPTAGSLTERQLDVIALAADGCDNRTIGRLLHIGEDTVKNAHARRVQEARARNRAHAVASASAVAG